MRKIYSLSVPILLSLVAANLFVWHSVWRGTSSEIPSLRFLDVGQGDSELIMLPGNVAILTDAGPDRKVVEAMDHIFPPSRRYIDIGIITHAQLDHYGGFTELLKHYRFGAFITNGKEADKGKGSWNSLIKKISAENIPRLALRAGDRIRYRDISIEFLFPNERFLQSRELNDGGLVEHVKTPYFQALLTADISSKAEQFLLKNNAPLAADILKVGHHGSKFSSSAAFLGAVNPRVAVIEVGARNTYGHPTPEVLARLENSAVQEILRTDEHGTISIIPENKKLKIYAER